MKQTLIIILLLVSSCSTERKCRRAEKLLCFTRHDSVRVDSFERIVRQRDTTKVVEIVKEYIRDSSKADSGDIITIKKYRKNGFVGTLIINWSNHTYDLDAVVLNQNKKETIKSVDSVKSQKSETKSKTDVVKPTEKTKDRFWCGVIVGVMSVLLLLYLIVMLLKLSGKPS